MLKMEEVFFKLTESFAVAIIKSILLNSITAPGFKNWVAGSSTGTCAGALLALGSGASQSSQALVFFSGSGIAFAG